MANQFYCQSPIKLLWSYKVNQLGMAVHMGVWMGLKVLDSRHRIYNLEWLFD